MVWNVPSIRSVVLLVKAPQSISTISLSSVHQLIIGPTVRVKTTKCYLFLVNISKHFFFLAAHQIAI